MSDITHLIRLFDLDSDDVQWRKNLADRVRMQIALMREEHGNYKSRAEAAEARAAELLKRLEDAQVYIGKLEDERDTLLVQLDFEMAHSQRMMEELDRANAGFKAVKDEYEQAMTRLAAHGEKVTA